MSEVEIYAKLYRVGEQLFSRGYMKVGFQCIKTNKIYDLIFVDIKHKDFFCNTRLKIENNEKLNKFKVKISHCSIQNKYSLLECKWLQSERKEKLERILKT